MSFVFITSLNYEKYYFVKGDSFTVSLFNFIKIKKIDFKDIKSLEAEKRFFSDTKDSQDKPHVHHIKISYKQGEHTRHHRIDIDKYELTDVRKFLQKLIENSEEVDEVLKSL